jgi:hypothetical protein
LWNPNFTSYFIFFKNPLLILFIFYKTLTPPCFIHFLWNLNLCPIYFSTFDPSPLPFYTWLFHDGVLQAYCNIELFTYILFFAFTLISFLFLNVKSRITPLYSKGWAYKHVTKLWWNQSLGSWIVVVDQTKLKVVLAHSQLTFELFFQLW